jgi:epoxyqueuosine reductase QueG
LRQWALEAGFHEAGVVALPYENAARDGARFEEWMQAGSAGTMDYLARANESGERLRKNIAIPFPWARTAIVCLASYHADQPRSTGPAPEGAGWIARYAWSSRIDPQRGLQPSDYHKVLLKRLRLLEAHLRSAFGEMEARAFVDTGPVVERSLAVAAGLGWTGKNTCLIHPRLGSYGFLGVLLTSLDLSVQAQNLAQTDLLALADPLTSGNRIAEELHCHPERSEGPAFQPSSAHHSKKNGSLLHSISRQNSELTSHSEAIREDEEQILRHAQDGASTGMRSTLALQPDRCGTCTRCIEACPTGALFAPYKMDAARCIAYLTIEHKGAIAPEWMDKMGRQIFGCDICQDVCPWNRRAPFAADAELAPRPELVNPALEVLAQLDEAGFAQLCNGSPLRRAGYTGLLRNLAIAMGNSGAARMIPCLLRWREAADSGLRTTARWALHKLRATSLDLP